MRILPMLLILSACATMADPNRAEDALAQDLAGRVAGAPQRCVAAFAQQPLEIAGPRTLVRRRGDTIWVNRLDRDCLGFGSGDPLIVETLNGDNCRDDRIRRLPVGSTIPGPTCLLNDWIPYRRPA